MNVIKSNKMKKNVATWVFKILDRNRHLSKDMTEFWKETEFKDESFSKMTKKIVSFGPRYAKYLLSEQKGQEQKK